MGVLHMPTAAGHHPLKSYPRHEAPPQIILKSVTFTMTTESPPRAPPLTHTSLPGAVTAVFEVHGAISASFSYFYIVIPTAM